MVQHHLFDLCYTVHIRCITLFGYQLLCVSSRRGIFLFALFNYVSTFHTLVTKNKKKGIHGNLFVLRMLPFQWKTPFGYLLAWFNTFFGALTGILSAPPFYNSIFASSWLFVIIADDDLKEELAAFNNDVKTSKGSDRAEIRQRFYSIIQSYWDAKEYELACKKRLGIE